MNCRDMSARRVHCAIAFLKRSRDVFTCCSEVTWLGNSFWIDPRYVHECLMQPRRLIDVFLEILSPAFGSQTIDYHRGDVVPEVRVNEIMCRVRTCEMDQIRPAGFRNRTGKCCAGYDCLIVDVMRMRKKSRECERVRVYFRIPVHAGE